MKYRNLSKKRKNKNVKRRKTRKTYRKKYKKFIGGNPPINIESGDPGLTIDCFNDVTDLTTYLEGLNYDTDKPSYVYVTIGSKPPGTQIEGEDTTNSEYQVIPGFFDYYEGKACIIMLDMFNKTSEDDNPFIEQSELIKSRYRGIKRNNPIFSLHIIMCNLHLTNDSRTVSTIPADIETERYMRESFIN
jgi:hypothetical protein